MSILFLFAIAGCGQTVDVPKAVPLVVPARDVPLTPEPDPIASQPEVTIRIVTDPLPVSSSAACPMDASVVVKATSGNTIMSLTGTCVDSSDGRSLILTCKHQWKDLPNAVITVVHEKKEYAASVLKIDEAYDLAVLVVQSNLPAIDLAMTVPAVGDVVTSVGLSGETVGELHCKVTGIDRYNRQKNIETDCRENFGRSGGGLFFNGALCGVVNTSTIDRKNSIYAGLQPIRDLLSKCGPVESQRFYDVEFVTANFFCRPCNWSSDRFSGGKPWKPGETIQCADGALRCTKVVGPRPWMTQEWLKNHDETGYPMYRVLIDGEAKVFFGDTSPELLLSEIEKKANTQPVSMPAGPVGATIEVLAVIESAFATIEKYAGRSASFKLLWTNKDGKKVLPIGQDIDFDEIRGTAGRVEFSCDSASVPLKQLSFDYAYVNGKIRFKLTGEAEIDEPQDGVVSSCGPVGDPATILYTIFSVAKTVWDLCHPTVSFVLPETLEARANFTGDELTIDCDGTGPALRLNWRLFLGLLRWEMNRPLTGLSISRERVELQFHRSKMFRDVQIEVR